MARRGPRLLDSPLDFAADIWILDDSLPSTTSSGEAQDSDTQSVSEGEYGEYIPLSPSPASVEAQDSDIQSVSEGEYGEYIPFSPSPASGEAQDSEIQLPPDWQDWFNPFASGDAPFVMPSFSLANDLLFPQVVVPAAPPSAAPSSPALLSTPSAASSPAPSPPPSAAPSSPALLSTPSAASSPAPSPPPSAASSSPALLSSPSAASSADPTASPSPSPSTSALTSSAKRSREDICTEEVSAKRWKVSDTFDAPSTSSGSFGVRRFWERPFSLSLDDSDSD
ncbi:vegetative cell wall protein gp1-like [Oreochromis aureus]|uniref:vegetative cell wall protein gp1-like n=1 Tax=Oreochromis aureus TaxID=47969 RepID=UPI0019535FED|nr:vegetative cell wall protein gp1-like [Oreochromis aureus]